MKKILSAILVTIISLTALTSCANPSSTVDKSASIPTSSTVFEDVSSNTEHKEDIEYVLAYPQNMQDLGFVDPIVMSKKPSKVVCMSSTPVLALHELGVEMVGVPTSKVVKWPEELVEKATPLEVSMNSNFDIETVVALAPDLVFVGKTHKDTYGKIMQDANIPVYYVDDGHMVSYDSVKSFTHELIKTFGENSPEAQTITEDFAKLEARLVEQKTKNAGQTVMVLQSSPPAHYIQTKGGTLGSMLDMMGFENVYENGEKSLVPLNMEEAISYDPDLFFAVGSAGTGEEFQAIMEADYANNAEYWNSIEAVKNGETFYLPISFISSAGINVIDNINLLIDMVEAHNAG